MRNSLLGFILLAFASCTSYPEYPALREEALAQCHDLGDDRDRDDCIARVTGDAGRADRGFGDQGPPSCQPESRNRDESEEPCD
jgi:hypothetical protein